MEIIFYDLPKISLNKWYAGLHWTKRKKMKDEYKLLILSRFKTLLPSDRSYHTEYNFIFKQRALDASNCVAMVKMIEDIIFEDDSYKIIKSIKITSEKGDRDSVKILVD